MSYRWLLLLTGLLLTINSGLYLARRYSGYTLGTTVEVRRDVTVTASIELCPNVVITPEKRIPPTHNNSLELRVDIRPHGGGPTLYSGTVTTDEDGNAKLCPLPSTITPGYYDILIKGLSHLRRNFSDVYLGGAGASLDFHTPILFAGDSHPSADNYVNSLDIAYEINHIYTTNDLRSDLNRDHIVNSLEFPTLISHLYQYGDN